MTIGMKPIALAGEMEPNIIKNSEMIIEHSILEHLFMVYLKINLFVCLFVCLFFHRILLSTEVVSFNLYFNNGVVLYMIFENSF